jgi:hypothetical protein
MQVVLALYAREFAEHIHHTAFQAAFRRFASSDRLRLGLARQLELVYKLAALDIRSLKFRQGVAAHVLPALLQGSPTATRAQFFAGNISSITSMLLSKHDSLASAWCREFACELLLQCFRLQPFHELHGKGLLQTQRSRLGG